MENKCEQGTDKYGAEYKRTLNDFNFDWLEQDNCICSVCHGIGAKIEFRYITRDYAGRKGKIHDTLQSHEHYVWLCLKCLENLKTKKSIQKILAEWQRKMGIKPNDDLKLRHLRTQTHSCDNQYCIQNGGDICDRVHCPIGQKRKQMTKEEILEGLYEIKNWKCGGDAEMHEIIEAAIQALETKNSFSEENTNNEDIISRQAAIDAIKDLPDCPNGYSDTYDKEQIIGVLEDVPSVQPEQRWIPVSERMPEQGQNCLVCDKGAIGIDMFIGHGNPYNWKWYVRDYEAWMPLPEPYKEVEQDG